MTRSRVCFWIAWISYGFACLCSLLGVDATKVIATGTFAMAAAIYWRLDHEGL
jgi:hypothetical protein